MIKKFSTTKRILVFILSVVMILSVGLAFTFLDKASVYAEVELSSWNNETVVRKGQHLQIPDGTKILVDGEEVTTKNIVIIYPDGSNRAYGEYNLDVVGQYQVKFVGEKNGETYNVIKPFSVKDTVYSYDENNSNASYRDFDSLTEEVYSYSSGSVVSKGVKKDLLAKQGVSGGIIDLKLGQNDVFKFNKIVNLNDMVNSDGLVDICTVVPGNYSVVNQSSTESYAQDAKFYLVKVVDAYDPTNFIEFYASAASNAYYLGCGASNQSLLKGVGGEVSADKANGTPASHYRYVYLDGAWHQVFQFERYTTGLAFGALKWAPGRSSVYTNSDGLFKFSLNPNTWQCYENGVLLNDLDNSALFPQEYERFKGFTTGEVYVQFECAIPSSSTIQSEVISIFNYSGEQLKDDFYVDTTAPVIEFDSNVKSGDKIYCSTNSEIELPYANVIDVNSDGSYQVAIYRNYNTANPISVNFKNNKLVPTSIGAYTVCYTAVDSYGNETVETIEIIAVNKAIISFTANDIEKLNVGEENLIPVLETEFMNGSSTQTLTLIYPNGDEVNVTNTKDGDFYKIVPDAIGEYTIKYTFSDGINNIVHSYKVNCVNDKNIVFYKEAINVPSNIIRDAYYDIEDYFAYVPTTSGLKTYKAEIWYSVNGKEYKKIENNHKFKLECDDADLLSNGENVITFKGVYNNTDSQLFTSRIIDLNFAERRIDGSSRKHYEKYFAGYDEVNPTTDGIYYGFDGKGVEKLEFATPIALGAFGVTFEIPAEKDNFGALSIVIRSISDKSQGYKITYAKLSDKTKINYQITSLDGQTVYMNADISASMVGEHTLDMVDGILKSSENINVEIPELNARNVEFFFELHNSTGKSEILVSKICNQNFTSSLRTKSEAKAEIIYEKDNSLHYLNDVCKLPSFNVSCALYPTTYRDLKTSIKVSDGSVAVDTNGNQLNNVVLDINKEYSYNINVMGNYFATFNFTVFGSEKAVEGVYNIVVKDETKPVVNFKDVKEGYAEIVDVNTKYTFKDYEAKDETTATSGLYIRFAVYTPNGNFIYWGSQNSYTFTEKGIYKIQIYCRDSAMNYATSEYFVSVK